MVLLIDSQQALILCLIDSDKIFVKNIGSGGVNNFTGKFSTTIFIIATGYH